MKVLISWFLLLLFMGLCLPPQAKSEPPADFSELTGVWREYLEEQDQPMWAIHTTEWVNESPSRLETEYARETRTWWIIDDPPYRLLRSVTFRDGEFYEETARGSNEDYIFHISKLADDSGYRLKSIAANKGSTISEAQRFAEMSRHSLQQRRFELAHKSNLVDLLSKNRKAFNIGFEEEGGKNRLVLRYSRADAAPESSLGFLYNVRSAAFYLSESRPWLPEKRELLYDPADDDEGPRLLATRFDANGYTKRTFHPDGAPFVTTKNVLEERPPRDPKLLNHTRLAAYGLPEPAIDTAPDLDAGKFALVDAALVGEKAPDFELPLLGGEPFKLSEHENEVIVLDFWATWCAPCVAGLPKLISVAKELEDEGVVLYAVNLGQDAETVHQFLDKQEFSVPVLLDQEEVLRIQYQAAIPKTVLVGKGGRIQAVHIGLPDEKQLREELKALARGEDLNPAGHSQDAQQTSPDASVTSDGQ